MFDLFLLAGLPYLAVFTLVAGSLWRFFTRKFTYSALSSQFLENNAVFWGSLPWHLGLGIVLAGHTFAFLFPQVFIGITGSIWMYLLEVTGLVASVTAFAGLSVLLVRRLLTSRIAAVTTFMDVVILLFLIFQVALGILTAVLYPWGSAWAPGTFSPYLWSLVSFSPNIGLVGNLPVVVKLHLAGAWVLLLLVPFSRLVHAFSLPFRYFFRRPQIVVWNKRY
ncbi:MAG: respiratory nitrate reductase subunit gamma [Bacteroidetes bacterium]|nr:respiratory nitrate reductase subunit gamma [Bacteroidota bacterium]